MSLNQICSNNNNKFLPEVYLNDLKTDSLALQNSTLSGYVPSNLNVYERYSKINIPVSGFTSSTTTGLEIIRIGNFVSVILIEKLGTSNGNPIVLTGAIEQRFLPVINLNSVPIVVDTISQPTPPNQLNGHLDLNASTGNITIYRTANHASFNNTATAGYRTFSFSYCI